MAERTEDLNLPLSVVTRLIKDALPTGVNVSKEARIAMARAASVFVLYATATANNYALKSKRRTLAAMDVVEAMKDMEFESFVEPLKNALEKFRQQQPGKTKRSSKALMVQEEDKDESESPQKRTAFPGDLDEVAEESGYGRIYEEGDYEAEPGQEEESGEEEDHGDQDDNQEYYGPEDLTSS